MVPALPTWSLLAACLPAPIPRPVLTIRGTITVDERLEVLADRATVGLVLVEIDGYEITPRGVWQTTSVSGLSAGTATYELVADWEPPDEAFTPASDEEPDIERATFLIGAWVDKDSIDGPSAGDDLVGTCLFPLTFWRGGVAADDAEAGAAAGWNIDLNDVVVAASAGHEFFPFHATVDGIDFQANLFPHHPDAISGTIDQSLTEFEALTGAVYSALGNCADPPVDGYRLLDLIERGATSFVLEGSLTEPPPSHFSVPDYLLDCDGPELLYGADVAPYVVLAYTASDGTLMAASPYGDPPRLLVYLKPTGIEAAVISGVGGGMGWQIVNWREDWGGLFAPWDEGVDLGETP